jgi:hypothetical protein
MSIAREFRTAAELSDMIVSALAVKDVAIQVRKGCGQDISGLCRHSTKAL